MPDSIYIQDKKLNINIWPKQKEFIEADHIDEIFFGGAVGGGKLLKLDGIILTPFGFKVCRDLRVGDIVNNPDGSKARIIQLHPIRKHPKWTVYFHDGTKTEVSREHLWLAWCASNGKKINGKREFGEKSAEVVETQELKAWLDRGYKPLIPVCKEQAFNVTHKWPSKLDPYLLGLLIGDGSIGDNGLSITSADTLHLKKELEGYEYGIYRLAHSFRGKSYQTLRSELKKLKLWGSYSHTKFVPRQFLYADLDSRYALVQGLLDTDGTVDTRGQVYFTTTSKQLSQDVQFLVQSLGGTATIFTKVPFCKVKGERKDCRVAYTLYIKHPQESKLFRLMRKKNRCRDTGIMYRRVIKVEEKGELIGRCLTVSHPNGLYLTNDFIVTHNSEALLLFALKRRMSIPNSLGIIFRRKLPDLEKSLILRSRKIFPLVGAKYNAVKHCWTFPNGSVQQFGFCLKESDIYDHQSAEYIDMSFDELTHFCVHPNTDVLTDSGWKKISSITRSDCVLSLTKSGLLKYSKPRRIQEFPFKGNLLELNQRKGMAFSVTPNHKMVVTDQKKKHGWKLVRADALPNFSFHVRAGKKIGGSNYCVRFKMPKGRGHGRNGNNVLSVNREDWLEFLGWYLSEGCAFELKTRVGKWSGPQVCIRQMKRVDSLEELLNRLGWRWRYYKDGSYKIFSRQLFSVVKPLGDTYTKRVPKFVFTSGTTGIKKFFDAFVAGDGWITKTGAIHLGLANEGLLDDLQGIATLLGRVSSKGFSRTKTGFDVWRLSISTPKRYATEVRIKDIKKVAYAGSVWCLTVNPHHNFVARYNGKVFITGNSEFQFAYLTTRVRSAIPGVKALIRGASNPGNIGHVWVKKRYIEPAKMQKVWTDEKEKKTLAFIPSFIEDNPSIYMNDPNYEDRLKIVGEKKYKALRFGDWDVFEGQFFNEWDSTPGQSVLREKRVPEKYHTKFLSLDWGYAQPACVLWWEVTPSGRIYVYRELYTTKRHPKELAADITMLCPDDEIYSGLFIPPELFGKEIEKEGGGEPIADLMQEVFKERIVLQKANNARVPGWQKCREYMGKAPDGFPWLQISPNCENLIRTLPAMVHDEHKPEDMDTDGEDHAPDAFRYGAVSLANVPKQMISPHRSFLDKVFQAARPEGPSSTDMRGRSGYGTG